MSHLLYGIVAAGAVATIGSAFALRDSRRMKHANGHSKLAVTAFWGSVGAYMLAFTLVRLAAAVGADSLLDGLYVFQTLAGASTIVALVSIIAQALLPPWRSGFATGTFLGLAILSVALIFIGGYQGPLIDHWSVEFLPDLLAARILIGAVYLLAPVVLAVLIRLHAGPGTDDRHRLNMFAASVVLMYLPNAGKYVILVEGPWNLVEAIVMTVGVVLGWASYQAAEIPHPRRVDSSSNG